MAQAEAGYPPDFSARDRATCRMVAPYTMTPPERIYALCEAVRYTVAAGIAGDFVECGVWKGGSMMAIARTLLECGVSDRRLWLFDTFDGMTDPTPADVNFRGVAAREKMTMADRDAMIFARAAFDVVQATMMQTGYPAAMIHYVKGAVEETLPGAAPPEIALIRLDTDWYESTLHEWRHLYPRLTRGGVIIVDDYGHWEGARQATDEYLGHTRTKLLLNRIDYSARIGVRVE